MDIQKERAEFESVFPCSVGTNLNEHGHYESQINQQDAMIQNISWVVWQAAKASALPDGYVVVPKEPTKEMRVDGAVAWCRNEGVHDIYKAMIEAAQEQS